jgi:hypothetical protein
MIPAHYFEDFFLQFRIQKLINGGMGSILNEQLNSVFLASIVTFRSNKGLFQCLKYLVLDFPIETTTEFSKQKGRLSLTAYFERLVSQS